MKRPLDRYAAKRSFNKSPEPGPRIASARRGPLMFVVQKHSARRLHYDFRLELDGVLKSWAVPKGPSQDPGDKRLAVEVEDHPFDYASFEGAIPEKQYGAGQVIVWDCGVYSPDEDQVYSFDDRDEAERRMRAELAKGKLSIFLRGQKLKGSFTLVKTSGGDKQWLLIKHKDRFVDVGDVLARSESVLSGRKVEDVSPRDASAQIDASRLAPTGPAESMPKKLAPMLAEVGDGARSDPAWLYEPKVDGYRVLALVEDGSVKLVSRRGLDMTVPFPEITEDLANQAVDTMIVDGEIVALTAEGRPSFNALQNRAQLKTAKEIAAARRDSPVAMMCFDLLHFAGLNLRDHAYVDRRRYLSQCLLPSAHAQLVHVSDDAEALYSAAIDNGLEGIVAKRKDSPYQPGRRSPAWRKIKAVQSADFVVGGYTRGKGAREPIGALLLGYRAGKELRYVGHVGSGLTDDIIAELRKRFSGLARKTSPFAAKPDLHRPTTWVDPKLVVEVKFQDRTPDGMLRAPVFLRLRDDLDSSSVRGVPRKPARSSRKTPTPASEVEAVLAQLEGTTEPPRSHGRQRSHSVDQPRSRVLAGQQVGRRRRRHEARSPAIPRSRIAVHAAASS